MRSAWSRSTTRTSTGCAESHMDAWQRAGGLHAHLPAVRRASDHRRDRRVPADERDGRARASSRCTTMSTSASRSTSNYEGLLVPVIRDADAKRLRAIAREIYDLADAGPIAEALARRDPRRHLHDLEQRLGRQRAHRRDHQPAAGRDHVDRRDQASSGRGRCAERGRGDRHPLGRQPRDELGPPGLRRRVRGRSSS